MKIPNNSNGIKTALILLDILAIAMLIVICIPDESTGIGFSIVFGFFALCLLIIVMGATFFAFGSYRITKDGISFKCPIYQKTCEWLDFKFIARYYVYTGRVNIPKEGYICSFNFDKSKLKRIHALEGSPDECFNIPYSEELETYILIHGADIYQGLLIDDRTDN